MEPVIINFSYDTTGLEAKLVNLAVKAHTLVTRKHQPFPWTHVSIITRGFVVHFCYDGVEVLHRDRKPQLGQYFVLMLPCAAVDKFLELPLDEYNYSWLHCVRGFLQDWVHFSQPCNCTSLVYSLLGHNYDCCGKSLVSFLSNHPNKIWQNF